MTTQPKSLDTDYDVICIDLYDVKHNASDDRFFNMRFGDASSTTITTDEYLFRRIDNTTVLQQKASQISLTKELSLASQGSFLQGQVFIYNANESSVITNVQSTMMSARFDSPNVITTNFATLRYAETNANVSFYVSANQNDASNSGTILGYYKVWGIKL